LLKEIEERCTPNCIVLYGSGVEGRDDERGDIDIREKDRVREV